MTLTSQPLADLHRHLDGSLRQQTVRDLAEKLGKQVPTDLCFFAGMGLTQALARFAFTLSLLQEPLAVQRIAREICEDAAAEGVTTLEIRFAPQLHQGSDIETIIDAALEGIDSRAGLLLCGLYGEPPDVLEQLVDLAIQRPGVVGIDLAGGPSTEHRWTLSDYASPFQRAAKLGLGTTVHAGEGRPPGEIRTAIEQLHAQRIGHGTTLLDDPSVLTLVIDRGVTIEACPTSNMHVGAIDSIEDHPLPHWLRAGVKVCLCTDNTLLSAVDAAEELRRAANIPGMSPLLLDQAVHNGHKSAFSR